MLFDRKYFRNYGSVAMPRRPLPSLDRLHTLREVARLGGFSAAADALALTQPAVSNQVRQLEQLLDVPLLERLGRTVRPTREGATLIAAAERAFAELETAMEAIARQQARITGTLVVAAGATATRHLLPAVIADLRARHPGIELRILTGNTNDLVAGLRDGTIDLGVLTAGDDLTPLATSAFFRDRLVCVTPPGEAPAAGTLRAPALEGRQLVLFDRGGAIRHAIDAWLAIADRARLRITDLGSAEAQIAFVRAGFGWTIVSEIAARDDAAAKRLDLRELDPPLNRDLVLAWHPDRATRPIIAAALAVFTAHAAGALGSPLQPTSVMPGAGPVSTAHAAGMLE
jgi:DNA-binding transcriptional LysR family regulator